MQSPFKEVKGIEILYTEEQIRRQEEAAAWQIAEKYLPLLEQSLKERQSFHLCLIAVLSGASRFRNRLADRVGQIFAQAGYFGYLEEDEIAVTSYDGELPGEIRLLLDTKRSKAGVHCILVEDIIDTGQTAAFVMDLLKAKKLASLELYVLIDKTPRREKAVEPAFVGFRLEKPYFLVGYGLDKNGRFRELPFIGHLIEKEP